MNKLKLLKGAPARLYVLDFGLFRVHAGPRDIGICGYLMVTDAEEHVLIDSGFPAKYAADPDSAAAEDGLERFGEVLSLGPENSVGAQLRRAGVSPDQIDLFLLTHTHIDHMGAIADLRQAPMLIGAAERALPRPLYWSDAAPQEWPERAYVTLAEDTRIGPGFDVLQAPGHAPGQLAMLVELPNTGPVLLTSDAISRPAEIDERFDTAPDPATALASARRLVNLAEEHGAFVVYGHDPAQWATLRKAPAFYD